MYRCKKQQVIALIRNNGKFFVGRNDCLTNINECPRIIGKCKEGEGYELCKTICEQPEHAEVIACRKAGDNARGGTLFLLGAVKCCENCKKVIQEYGIKKIIFIEETEDLSENSKSISNKD